MQMTTAPCSNPRGWFNTLRSEQNGPQFAMTFFKNERILQFVQISQKFVPESSIDNYTA